MNSLLKTILALACVTVCTDLQRLLAGEIPQIGPGPFAVGSTNMTVTEKPAAPMIDYLKGKVRSEGTVSIVDILKYPDSSIIVKVQIPDIKKVYSNNAGRTLPIGVYVLYPTSKDNSRDNYKFPYSDTGDNVFPHMQKPGETPIFADKTAKYPVIVYSTGYESHGLWDLAHLKALAAHGYIVVGIFHADGCFSFPNNFSLRPIVLEKVLDAVLKHPDFGPAIDSDRIGVSGSSFGGYTILATMGGNYLKSVETVADPRIKAGFGLVPFTGSIFRWPFGKDWSGLKSVRVPFMAVYGEKDTNVPPETVLGSIAKLSGTASAIMFDGEKHILSDKVWPEVYTWEVLFFDTWLKGDAKAGKLIYENDSVQGATVDRKTYQKIVDKPPQG